VYSGDVDGIVPTLASRRWIENMHGKKIRNRWQYWVEKGGQIGGWGMRWTIGTGELTFATVRGAGHQVPSYQPRRAFQLFESFLYNGSLPVAED